MAPPSGAQSSTTFGITGGVNLARWTGQGFDETITDRTGVVGGLVVRTFATPGFTIQTEILYAQRGAKVPTDQVYTYEMDWVQVPVMAQLLFGSSGRDMSPFLMAGPSAAWRVRCALSSPDERYTCDELDLEVKELDVSMILGGGISLGALMLSARYDLGLTNLSREAGETVKSRVLTVMLGIMFGRGARPLP